MYLQKFTLCSMRWLITLNLYIFVTVLINWQNNILPTVEIFLVFLIDWQVFDIEVSPCNFPSGIWELIVVLSGVAIFFNYHSTLFSQYLYYKGWSVSVCNYSNVQMLTSPPILKLWDTQGYLLVSVRLWNFKDGGS